MVRSPRSASHTSSGEAYCPSVEAAPHHPPYERFIPAPGHGLGFNDLKVIECRELIRRISGERAHLIEFEDGIRIERTVDAIARSAHEGRWVEVRDGRQ